LGIPVGGFFTVRMPFLTPNQQLQSTDGSRNETNLNQEMKNKIKHKELDYKKKQ